MFLTARVTVFSPAKAGDAAARPSATNAAANGLFIANLRSGGEKEWHDKVDGEGCGNEDRRQHKAGDDGPPRQRAGAAAICDASDAGAPQTPAADGEAGDRGAEK